MNGSNCILLAEQDCQNNQDIRCFLEGAGFDVILALAGDQVLKLVEQQLFDLIILNIHLPVISGVECCRKIRAKAETPVMLITMQGDDQEIMDGLDAGAADFLMQPVRPYELIARVRTVLKRTSSPLALPGWILQCGDMMLDVRSHSLIHQGHKIPISPIELRLLSYFMRHSGEIIRKEDLLKNVWGYQAISGDYNMVDTAIKRLRQLIEEDPKRPLYIQTVWGEGYYFGK